MQSDRIYHSVWYLVLHFSRIYPTTHILNNVIE